MIEVARGFSPRSGRMRHAVQTRAEASRYLGACYCAASTQCRRMFARVQTTRFTRGRLPHWEVERGRYFVTVRCHDSLPREVVARLQEIQSSLRRVEARSDEFVQLQRRYFFTMEKFLDAGSGSAPLRRDEAAAALVAAFAALPDEGVSVPHFAIMPNHWHALLEPVGAESIDLHRVMTRLKGRTSRAVNLALGRSGML